MTSGILGRTNRAFPSTWLRLSGPAGGENAAEMAEGALATQAPIDISASPALWGGHMRGTDATLIGQSSYDYERSTEEAHAADLIDAHLLEIFSCIGRPYLDIYFVRVRREVEAFQISGALAALDAARQEGHIRHLGVACEGEPSVLRALWHGHDAFELILATRDALKELAPLAHSRRVGIVERGAAGDLATLASDCAKLIPVRTAAEIRAALAPPLGAAR